MSVTHDNFIIDQTVVLAPAPTQIQGFYPLLIDSATTFTDSGDGLGNFVPLRSYSSIEDVILDGELSAYAEAAVTAALSQSPAPAQVYVAGFDVADTYETAFNRILTDTEFEPRFLCIDSTDPLDLIEAFQAASAAKCVLVAQLEAEQNITGSLEVAETSPYLMYTWHDDALQPAAFAYLAKFLAYDPDFTSRGGQTQVLGVDGYTRAVTSNEYNLAQTNYLNLFLPFGPAPLFLSPGLMSDGRSISETLSTIWYEVRAKEDLIRFWLREDAAGRKIPVNRQGQRQIADIYRRRFDLGVNAGHFEVDQLVVNFPDITAADLDAARIPIEIAIQTTTGAVKILSTVEFSRVPVVSEG